VERVTAFVTGFSARALAGAEARLVAQGEAERFASAERASGFVTAEMLASAELAVALRVSPRSMDRHLDHARDLDGPMRPLRDALDTGTLSAAHASAVARELTRLPAAGDADRAAEYATQCARVLAIVIPYAAAHTPGQAAKKTRALVLAVDPVGADARRRDAAEHDHGVWLTPTEHGSCELTAVLPLVHGAAVMDAITTLAADPRFETGDGCLTIGQRRVAALVTLMLGDPGKVATIDGPVAEAKITAHVTVVVPLAALTSTDPTGQGGTIAGEPVTADTLRDLLVDAAPTSTLRRLVTDTAGCIVDAGRTRYAISDTQRHLIALRDRTCRRRRGLVGGGGRRECVNGEHPRRSAAGHEPTRHYDGKSHGGSFHGGWTITTSRRNGACTWRSPLGRIYHHQPPGVLPEHHPEPADTGPLPF
jgi:hypothetical protein